MKIKLFNIFFLITIFNFKMMFSQNTFYSFDSKTNLNEWVIVNDDVMGGVSKSNLITNKDYNGVFFGNISIENNGGFASVRFNFKRLNISKYKSIILKIKGDQKEYQFRIKESLNDYHSYVYPFSTSGEWEFIKIPLNKMYPSFRGRSLNMKNFNKDYFEQVSFLISNKKNVNFNLLIDSIILE